MRSQARRQARTCACASRACPRTSRATSTPRARSFSVPSGPARPACAPDSHLASVLPLSLYQARARAPPRDRVGCRCLAPRSCVGCLPTLPPVDKKRALDQPRSHAAVGRAAPGRRVSTDRRCLRSSPPQPRRPAPARALPRSRAATCPIRRWGRARRSATCTCASSATAGFPRRSGTATRSSSRPAGAASRRCPSSPKRTTTLGSGCSSTRRSTCTAARPSSGRSCRRRRASSRCRCVPAATAHPPRCRHLARAAAGAQDPMFCPCSADLMACPCRRGRTARRAAEPRGRCGGVAHRGDSSRDGGRRALRHRQETQARRAALQDRAPHCARQGHVQQRCAPSLPRALACVLHGARYRHVHLRPPSRTDLCSSAAR